MSKVAKTSSISAAVAETVLALATLGNAMQAGPVLTVLQCPRYPRQVQSLPQWQRLCLPWLHLAMQCKEDQSLLCCNVQGRLVKYSLGHSSRDCACLGYIWQCNARTTSPCCVSMSKVAKASAISVTVAETICLGYIGQCDASRTSPSCVAMPNVE
jgi:hypothetical protein